MVTVKKPTRPATIVALLAAMDAMAGACLAFLPHGAPKQAAFIAWALATGLLLLGVFVLSVSGRHKR